MQRFVWLAAVLAACSGSDEGGDTETDPTDTDDGTGTADWPQCHDTTIPTSLCDPATATFSLGSTNEWYPLIVGSLVSLEGAGTGDEAGIVKTVERRVLAETRTLMGVEVHVLEHQAFFDGIIHEIALNFYVEADDGTVCYFGEEVEFFDESGVFVNTDGTWEAGVDGALPGVIMPKDPVVGDAYYQEAAPGIALDQGRVDAVDLTTDIDGVAYDTIRVIDTNPIDDEEPCEEEEKRYARGIGEIKDVALEIVSFTAP